MAEPVVYLDPAEVEAFAKELSATVDYYTRVIERLELNVDRLGRTWRDEQFEEFKDEVKTLKLGLKDYVEEARAARRRLDDLAESARRYQQIQSR